MFTRYECNVISNVANSNFNLLIILLFIFLLKNIVYARKI